MQMVDENECNATKQTLAIVWRGLSINVAVCPCHLPLPCSDGSDIKFIELAVANYKKDQPGLNFGEWWRLHLYIYALEMNTLIGRVNDPQKNTLGLALKRINNNAYHVIP